jgi:hypothetical protein
LENGRQERKEVEKVREWKGEPEGVATVARDAREDGRCKEDRTIGISELGPGNESADHKYFQSHRSLLSGSWERRRDRTGPPADDLSFLTCSCNLIPTDVHSNLLASPCAFHPCPEVSLVPSPGRLLKITEGTRGER